MARGEQLRDNNALQKLRCNFGFSAATSRCAASSCVVAGIACIQRSGRAITVRTAPRRTARHGNGRGRAGYQSFVYILDSNPTCFATMASYYSRTHPSSHSPRAIPHCTLATHHPLAEKALDVVVT